MSWRGRWSFVVASLVVASLGVACNSPEAEPRYGSIALVLHSAESDPAATFAGTATVVATVGYGACIGEFYREHEDEAFDRADGEAVAKEWRAALCDDEAIEPAIACDVVALEQYVDAGVPRLIVTLSVTDEIEGRRLAAGPLPDPDSADCSGGALPSVHVGADAAIGRDADGAAIWTARAVGDSVAVVDQEEPVDVYATRIVPP